jgi:hypothetical protein
LIDEVGAFDGIERLGPDEALLFSILMRATQEGVIEFVPSPADNLPLHNVLLFDDADAVPTEQIEYRSVEILVGPGTPLRTNPANSLDVNNDFSVSPIDALLVINQLNAELSNAPAARAATATSYYLDVSADGFLSPLDALLVINKLNAAAGEGESPNDGLAAVAAAIDADTSSTRSGEDEPSVGESPVLADASRTTVVLGQQSKLFDSIDGLDLVHDNEAEDDMDSVLDLICDDLVKRV